MKIEDFEEIKKAIALVRKVCPDKEYDFDIEYWSHGGWVQIGMLTKVGNGLSWVKRKQAELLMVLSLK